MTDSNRYNLLKQSDLMKMLNLGKRFAGYAEYGCLIEAREMYQAALNETEMKSLMYWWGEGLRDYTHTDELDLYTSMLSSTGDRFFLVDYNRMTRIFEVKMYEGSTLHDKAGYSGYRRAVSRGLGWMNYGD